ncbi:cation:proton antiporter [Candidatus Neomarinimicrobiota bacterium]
MNMNPLMIVLAGTAFAVLLLGAVLQRFRQPQIVTYLIAGIFLGPFGIGLMKDVELIESLGEGGVILLLFFLGMEMSLPRLIANWRVAIIGTSIQIGISVGIVILIGSWLQWPAARSILLGFVISLSSTAVVIPLLQSRGEIDTPVGRDVIGVLLMQDLAVIPMLLVIGYMTDYSGHAGAGILQVLGLVLFTGLMIYVARKRVIRLPFRKTLREDHELQVFAAFALCFGMAFLSATFGLSTAVGALMAGFLISSAKETEWVRTSLEPFRVLLVAFFFISVGMLLDLSFLRKSIGVVVILVALTLVINTSINSAMLRAHRRSWRNSWYGGALLSQIGEFSFVLATVGYQAKMVSDFGYQATIATIVLTMLVSTVWIASVRWFTKSR